MNSLCISKLHIVNTNHNFRPSVTWKKISPFHFSHSWHRMKLKVILGMPLDWYHWLVKSSTWSSDFFSKPCLVLRLHLRYVVEWRCHISSPFSTTYHWSKFQFHAIWRSWNFRKGKCRPAHPIMRTMLVNRTLGRKG